MDDVQVLDQAVKTDCGHVHHVERCPQARELLDVFDPFVATTNSVESPLHLVEQLLAEVVALP